MSESIKLAYNYTKRIVRISFAFGECFAGEKPPKDVLDRAENKMQSEVVAGNIDIFELFPHRLEDVWSTIRSDYRNENPRRIVTVAVAEGARRLKNIQITPGNDSRVAFEMTIDCAAAVVEKWRPEAVVMNANLLAKKAKLTEGQSAQIIAAFIRAVQGEKILRLPILRCPSIDQNSEKLYKLMAVKSRREIIVSIERKEALQDRETLREIIKKCGDAISSFGSSSGYEYSFFKDEMTAKLASAVNGPEALGVGLPLAILVSLGSNKDCRKKYEFENRKAPKKKLKKAIDVEDQQDGPIKFKVLEGGMEAVINEFSMSVYRLEPEMSINWLVDQCRKQKLTLEPNNINNFIASIKAKKDLTGMTVAVGKIGQKPKKPYLHLSYKDMNLSEDEEMDLREAQAFKMVYPGDLVAVVKYKEAGKHGVDVKGRKVPPPAGEALIVDIGEGIELKKNGEYYATLEGQPLWQDGHLSISKSYIHEGDINLKSGNLTFDGPATIKGSIQSGATVVVSGDLVVEGSIGSASVRVGGSVTVTEGIITSENGRVRARNKISAAYISNSNIICGGDLEVKRTIMNSEIICGGSLKMNRTNGVLAASNVSCRGDMDLGRLGLPQGEKTICQVGLDWRAEFKLRICSGRWKKLKKKNEETRKKIRELLRKTPAQTTVRHREKKEKLQADLIRQREVMDKVKAKLEHAQSLVNWDKEVRVLVFDVMSVNCSLKVGGSDIGITGETKYVVIAGVRKRGGFINPITEEDFEAS